MRMGCLCAFVNGQEVVMRGWVARCERPSSVNFGGGANAKGLLRQDSLQIYGGLGRH